MRERLQINLRSWLLVTHLVVLAIPVAFLILSGLMRAELSRQSATDLWYRAPLVARVLADQLDDLRRSAEEGSTPNLADLPHDVLASLAPPDNEARPAHIWLFDAYGNLIDRTNTGDPTPPATDGLDAALSGNRDVRVLPQANAGPWERFLERFTPRGRVVASVPVRLDDTIVGALVMERRPLQVGGITQAWSVSLPLVAFLAVWTTALLALVVADQLGRSLESVVEVTTRIADGDLAAAAVIDKVERTTISEVADLSDAIRRMASRIELRMQFVQEFAGNAAHEFRTPLAQLVGMLELLEDDEMAPDDRRRFLDSAAGSVMRLRAIVDGLLALARAERSDGRTIIDLHTLATEAAKGQADLRGRGGKVKGDPGTLRMVLDNLVRNAHKHGVPPVEVVCWEDGDRCGWDVIDRGDVPAEVVTQVFDRFFTTDRESGVGLGLALVRAVVESHGGEVTLQSVPGRTRFRVSLPRLVDEG